ANPSRRVRFGSCKRSASEHDRVTFKTHVEALLQTKVHCCSAAPFRCVRGSSGFCRGRPFVHGEVFIDPDEPEYLPAGRLEIEVRIREVELLDTEGEDPLFHL